ncbi:MAG TPA: SxtJ family membrane protein [Polyangia bacterium]|nr:SxtJ family membrane protein [Polyangia bacterium]
MDEPLPPDFDPVEGRPSPSAADPAKARARRGELRKFGLTVGGVFLAIAVYLALRHRIRVPFYVVVSLGSLLTLGGALAPSLLSPVQRVWMGLAHVLGWINARVLLSVVFFLIMTPMSLVMRLFGRDPLKRRFEKGRASYWEDRPREALDPESYRRQF